MFVLNWYNNPFLSPVDPVAPVAPVLPRTGPTLMVVLSSNIITRVFPPSSVAPLTPFPVGPVGPVGPEGPVGPTSPYAAKLRTTG